MPSCLDPDTEKAGPFLRLPHRHPVCDNRRELLPKAAGVSGPSIGQDTTSACWPPPLPPRQLPGSDTEASGRGTAGGSAHALGREEGRALEKPVGIRKEQVGKTKPNSILSLLLAVFNKKKNLKKRPLFTQHLCSLSGESRCV